MKKDIKTKAEISSGAYDLIRLSNSAGTILFNSNGIFDARGEKISVNRAKKILALPDWWNPKPS